MREAAGERTEGENGWSPRRGQKHIPGRINRVVLFWRHGRAALRNASVISSCRSNSTEENAKTDKGKVGGTRDTCRAISIAADTTEWRATKGWSHFSISRIPFSREETKRDGARIKSRLKDQIFRWTSVRSMNEKSTLSLSLSFCSRICIQDTTDQR